MKPLNILAYNLFFGEDDEQITFIKDNDYDIVLLSEASKDIDTKLDNYIGDKEQSHCGYTYLGINKKLKIEILTILKSAGIVIMHVKLYSHEMVICSVHLTPYKKNANIRNIQLFRLNEILDDMKLSHLPIIIGGDTNMTNDENDSINEYGLIDYTDNNATYPNRPFVNNKNDKRITFISPTDFRYDRFFIKNCKGEDFKIIPNNNSDHLAINMIINL